jgi:hypothetical protein
MFRGLKWLRRQAYNSRDENSSMTNGLDSDRLGTICGLLVLVALAYLPVQWLWMNWPRWLGIDWPLDYTMKLKKSRKEALEMGLCPFCLEEKPLNDELQTGYRRRSYSLGNRGIFALIKIKTQEQQIYLPICECCKNRFLNCSKHLFFMRPIWHPGRLLERKAGWLRGVGMQFLASNVRPLSKTLA